MSQFTQKDYETVARVLGVSLFKCDQVGGPRAGQMMNGVRMTIAEFVHEFKADNDKFNETRFRDAIGAALVIARAEGQRWSG